MSLNDLEELLTPRETAKALSISTRTLSRWEEAGLLHPIRLTSRVVRYSLADIKRLIINSGTTKLAAPKGQTSPAVDEN